ncbi:nucleoside monophosphate kinase [Candidatus Woesearchaeota archaeon]|nr:nucleoside monophosphate kinase [Candidatus Woesearchaeota archaeon]
MKLIIMGPQASGKGTQAKKIAKKYKLKHISMGEIFREISRGKDELGKKVKELIDNGNMVPDETTNEIVKKNISKNKNFILDGYPRNIEQVKFLNNTTDIDNVIFINTSHEEIIKRITGRRKCPECGKDYNINVDYLKPGKNELCDKCKVKLEKREDDNPTAIRIRLATFEEKTMPVLDYYRNEGILIEVNGNFTIEEIFKEITEKIEKRKKEKKKKNV